MEDTHDWDSDAGGFPLSVDLSPYIGVQAHCRVWVRRRARKICWLATRIRQVAGLRGPLLLLAGGQLLPPGESLKLLRPDDILRVARVEHEWQRPFSFQEQEDSQTEPAVIVSNSYTTPSEQEQLLQNASAERLLKLKCSQEPDSIGQSSAKRKHNFTKPTLSEATPEPIDHEALSRVKQRALALLQKVSGETEDDKDVVDAPKKKRRRVRRRRPVRDTIFSEPDPQSESMKNGSTVHPIQPEKDSDDEEPLDNPESLDTQNSSTIHEELIAPPSADLSKVKAVTPSPAVVSMVSMTPGPPTVPTCPQPMLVRNPTPPRAPRLVRALSTDLSKLMDTLVNAN